MVVERSGAVTFKSQPLTLVGPELTVGDRAPDARLVNNQLSWVALADSRGTPQLISVVPSLDTPVCSVQTKRFNEAASTLPASVTLLTVSADLPFAQARFCGAEGIGRVQTLSDHRGLSFGEAYGVLVKELRLLSRAIFVVDPSGVLRHVEYVKEITEHPNYDAALQAITEAAAV